MKRLVSDRLFKHTRSGVFLMQRIIGLILILWGLGWFISEIPSMPESPPPAESIAWRRTCNGWQRARWLAGELPPARPALHPALFGAGMLMFSLAGLLGLTPEKPDA